MQEAVCESTLTLGTSESSQRCEGRCTNSMAIGASLAEIEDPATPCNDVLLLEEQKYARSSTLGVSCPPVLIPLAWPSAALPAPCFDFFDLACIRQRLEADLMASNLETNQLQAFCTPGVVQAPEGDHHQLASFFARAGRCRATMPLHHQPPMIPHTMNL